jgi:hypothetical protein
MRDQVKHFPVNWIDGMKINKNHFISQDMAFENALSDVASLGLSPLRYGILAASTAGEDTCNIRVSIDNQNTVRVSVLSCQAITQAGIRISIPSLGVSGQQNSDGVPAASFQFPATPNEPALWIVLLVHPYEKQAAGSPDLSENPPRYPYVLPSYTIQIIGESQYRQFANHPYAIMVGKLLLNGTDIRVDDEYIPPCFTIKAHADLVSLYAELDAFFGSLELKCSQIVQKIYRKNQQNEISELVLFLCDRVLLHLAQAITSMRWFVIHESPVYLFYNIASLSRVMKNAIDMRIGSGKDEMMNYFSEWSELKQGELETLLTSLASIRYDNNDINVNIHQVIKFVKICSGLFDTLSKLEFIGKKKESGIFVKEELQGNQSDANKPRRRFFG